MSGRSPEPPESRTPGLQNPMASKLFYSLEEACRKLGKSEDEVRDMVSSGQIQEFRDGEHLVFKREQVDLLVGGDELSDIDLDIGGDSSAGGGSSLHMGLADTGAPPAEESEEEDDRGSAATPREVLGGSGYGLSETSSGSGFGLADSAMGESDAGLAIGSGDSDAGLNLGEGNSGLGLDLGGSGSEPGFDLGETGEETGIGAAFEGGEDDDAAETRVSDAVDEELSLESVGSGSGLLDLTRESDDTSLGAELLDEVWDSGSGEFGASASGLFESSESESGSDESAAPAAAAVGMPMAAAMMEAYDGTWSGLGIGLMIGAAISLTAVLVMLVFSVANLQPSLAAMMTENMLLWGGGLAGVAIVCGLVGMFLGKASE